MTDESGKVTKTYEYDSFGNEVKPDGKDDNPFRYCGEYYDKETEEVYLRARYYQPTVGRFLTRDTYTGEADDPLSLHLYTYCENDGVNAWDPSGHSKIRKTKATKVTKERKRIIHKEISAMTDLGKEEKKQLFKKVIENRNNWCTDISKSKLKKTRSKNASMLLARMLYGECTATNMGDDENRNEMIAFWLVVKNASTSKRYISAGGVLNQNVKKELLDEERYHGLTGKKRIARGRTPVSDINWARAVIIATVYQKKKWNKLKDVNGITNQTRYWLTTTLWNKWYNKSKGIIKFSKDEKAKVKSYKKYATTVFYGIYNDYKYDFK